MKHSIKNRRAGRRVIRRLGALLRRSGLALMLTGNLSLAFVSTLWISLESPGGL